MRFLRKRLLPLIVAIILSVLSFSACEANIEGDKPMIVVSIYPAYDYVLSVLGDKRSEFEVRLLANGVDMHSFSPSFEDMISISRCDLFIYVGGESDGWADAAVKNKKQSAAVIKLLDVLGDKALIERSESEEEELDEHVWLSVKNSALFVSEITDAISRIDGDNAEHYAENSASYLSSLSALDEEYQTVTENAKRKTLVFGDRFPFLYLTEDYGLEYYAAYSGCSAESQVSFETIVSLANVLDQNGIKRLCVTETADLRLAESIIFSTKSKDATIVTLDSLQSKFASDYQKGETYIYCMRKNLNAISLALNEG